MGYVVEIAEAKYPKEQGYRLFWVFNQAAATVFSVRMH